MKHTEGDTLQTESENHMASKKNVTAATVREWAKENLSSIPAEGHFSVMGRDKADRTLVGDGSNVRGRLHPTVVAAYNKANKGRTYEEKVAEARTVSFDVALLNKAGRVYKKTVTITTGEARVLLGQPTDRRGRMSHKALAEAYAASL